MIAEIIFCSSLSFSRVDGSFSTAARGHPLSTYAKFSEKLTFEAPKNIKTTTTTKKINKSCRKVS